MSAAAAYGAVELWVTAGNDDLIDLEGGMYGTSFWGDILVMRSLFCLCEGG
jgi:hypothetical protein